MWFTTIKRFYDSGHTAYNDESLKNFVVANMITSQQYKEITDIKYVS